VGAEESELPYLLILVQDACSDPGAAGSGVSKEDRVSEVPSSNPIEAGRAIADHAARLAKLEFELKAVELRGKAVRLGLGAGLGLLAVLLAPLLVIFVLATIAAVLSTVLQVWVAILIVSGLLLVLIGGLAGASVALISAERKGRTDDQG
jgi:CBS domain containing-hemolysin-like protein